MSSDSPASQGWFTIGPVDGKSQRQQNFQSQQHRFDNYGINNGDDFDAYLMQYPSDNETNDAFMSHNALDNQPMTTTSLAELDELDISYNDMAPLSFNHPKLLPSSLMSLDTNNIGDLNATPTLPFEIPSTPHHNSQFAYPQPVVNTISPGTLAKFSRVMNLNSSPNNPGNIVGGNGNHWTHEAASPGKSIKNPMASSKIFFPPPVSAQGYRTLSNDPNDDNNMVSTDLTATLHTPNLDQHSPDLSLRNNHHDIPESPNFYQTAAMHLMQAGSSAAANIMSESEVEAYFSANDDLYSPMLNHETESSSSAFNCSPTTGGKANLNGGSHHHQDKLRAMDYSHFDLYTREHPTMENSSNGKVFLSKGLIDTRDDFMSPQKNPRISSSNFISSPQKRSIVDDHSQSECMSPPKRSNSIIQLNNSGSGSPQRRRNLKNDGYMSPRRRDGDTSPSRRLGYGNLSGSTNRKKSVDGSILTAENIALQLKFNAASNNASPNGSMREDMNAIIQLETNCLTDDGYFLQKGNNNISSTNLDNGMDSSGTFGLGISWQDVMAGSLDDVEEVKSIIQDQQQASQTQTQTHTQTQIHTHTQTRNTESTHLHEYERVLELDSESLGGIHELQELDEDDDPLSSTLPMAQVDVYMSGPDSDGKFQCLFPECGKNFGRRYNIRSHIRTHLSDRPFKCETCQARFVRHHDLKRHLRIHEIDKHHECPCGKRFARQDALTRHRLRMICCGGIEIPGRERPTPRKRGRPPKSPQKQDMVVPKVEGSTVIDMTTIASTITELADSGDINDANTSFLPPRSPSSKFERSSPDDEESFEEESTPSGSIYSPDNHDNGHNNNNNHDDVFMKLEGNGCHGYNDTDLAEIIKSGV